VGRNEGIYMTVKELIAELSKLPPGIPVRLADESGDYGVPVAAVRIQNTTDSYEAACLVRGSEG
jgi:ribosomal protein S12 methylthiotransferase accessory factor YcaO